MRNKCADKILYYGCANKLRHLTKHAGPHGIVQIKNIQSDNKNLTEYFKIKIPAIAGNYIIFSWHMFFLPLAFLPQLFLQVLFLQLLLQLVFSLQLSLQLVFLQPVFLPQLFLQLAF